MLSEALKIAIPNAHTAKSVRAKMYNIVFISSIFRYSQGTESGYYPAHQFLFYFNLIIVTLEVNYLFIQFFGC